MVAVSSSGRLTLAGPVPASSTGAFSEAALKLSGLGLLVIPLGDDLSSEAGKPNKRRRPLVSNFQKYRWPFRDAMLQQLVAKFPLANIGIVTGRVSSLVVLDIDDAALLPQMLARFGETPLKVRTPSGGLHLYYRWSGEGCPQHLRQQGFAVDVKGQGGLVVAPPSTRPDGSAYTLYEGSWADLVRLPPMKDQKTTAAAPNRSAEPTAQIPNGRRDTALFDHLREVAHLVQQLPQPQLEALLRDAGRRFRDQHLETVPSDPITDSDIDTKVRSVLRLVREGKVWVKGQLGGITVSATAWDLLQDDPEALAFYMFLHTQHGSRTDPFAVVSEAMAEACSYKGFGRTTQRYERAKKKLIAVGLLVHACGRGRRGDPRKYAFGIPPGNEGQYNWTPAPRRPPAPGEPLDNNRLAA